MLGQEARAKSTFYGTTHNLSIRDPLSYKVNYTAMTRGVYVQYWNATDHRLIKKYINYTGY